MHRKVSSLRVGGSTWELARNLVDIKRRGRIEQDRRRRVDHELSPDVAKVCIDGTWPVIFLGRSVNSNRRIQDTSGIMVAEMQPFRLYDERMRRTHRP